MAKRKTPGFEITGVWGASGFQITFENGWTVSVQFGPGTYSSNHDAVNDSDRWEMREKKWDAHTAEVAAWDKNGDWYDFDGDNVAGYKTPEQVIAFLVMVASGVIDNGAKLR